MFRLATQPQSIARVLDSGMRLFTASFSSVLVFALVAATLSVIPGVVAELILSQTITTETIGLGALVGAYIVIVLVSIVLYSAIVLRAGHLATGGTLGMTEALGRALRRAPRVLLVASLYAVSVLLGTILLVVPGVIVALTFYFAMTAVLLDNDRAMQSLAHSHRLVWGNWWRTATVMTVPFAIYFVLYIALFTIFGVMVGFGGESTGDPGPMFFLYGGEILIATLAMPLINAVTIVQYYDLKMRKEGADLGSRIDLLTAAGR